MARGRTLFSEHRRRAASVPVEDLSFPDTTTASKLFNIRSDVAHNTDALLSASKRHDRDFLHKVQSSLPPTYVKATPTLNHNRGLRPPPARSAYYVAAASAAAAPAPAPSSTYHDLRRRTWYGPTSSRVDDAEVAAYLATPVRPPYVSRALRAGSVPPVLPSRATAARWFPTSSGSRGSSVPRWNPSSYRTYGSSYLQSHPDLEDVVVGVAPTTQYGDIVIGIPYHKQFLFDAQRSAVDNYHPRIPVATRVTSPYFAYRKSPLYESYEDVDIPSYSSRARYSTSVPGYGARSSVSVYPASQPLTSTGTGARFSTTGYPPRASSAKYTTPVVTDYSFDLSPKDSLSNLRLRTSIALDKARGPSLTSSGSGSLGTTHIGLPPSTVLAPLPPQPAAAPSSGAISSKPFKPQISETRQRVRDLLCKSKKDPHYFD